MTGDYWKRWLEFFLLSLFLAPAIHLRSLVLNKPATYMGC